MRNAAAQFLLRVANPVDGAEYVLHQFVHIVGATVGQFPFGQRPDSFIRIELRGIRRKILDAQAAMPAEKLFERRPFVRGGVIQQNDDGAEQMAQQFTQKHADLILPDVVVEEQIVQTKTMPSGAYGDSRNNGDLVPPALAVAMNGSLSLWLPSSHHVGNQLEARFIGKDEMGAQPCGVFFIRGQSFCFQRAIFSSFRSSARRSGFCGVQPRLCIRRPIWSG